ncbi:hypothetical protein [Paenibacillus sp. QZ-Y1]|uniref:hypothetical protein n=1 Tax=Paenibacillus sp. QZ-Y1 TaxID=3414511 RepID=UPI003F7B2092
MKYGEDKRYYHVEYCHGKYLKDKEFKAKERLEMDQLANTIARIHKLKTVSTIPNTFYPYIQELRNDSVLFGRVSKRYKQGITYQTIENTYTYCSEKIEWAKGNKEFKNLMSELKYCFAIVKNNIENCLRDESKSAKQKAETEILINHVDSMRNVNKAISNAQTKRVNENKDLLDITTLFD